MSSRHLVDPELAPVLDLAPEMGVGPGKLDTARAAAATMTEMSLAAADPSVKVTEHFVPADGAPDVRLIIYRPDGLPNGAPILFQIHGGGFLFGTAELGDPRNRMLAKSLQCAVASVDYRVAPETQHPGPIEDCYAALKWVHDNARELGLDPGRIALRGESAGGGLAAALALLARDRGGPPILMQLLVYPMLDDRTCGAEATPHTGEFIWDRASNAFAWESLLGVPPCSPDVSHYAAAGRAKDLSGLPPTCLVTAALDLFVEEDLDFAKRLIRAGVPTEVYVAPGAFHGFEAMVPDADVSRRFIAAGVDAVRRAFAG